MSELYYDGRGESPDVENYDGCSIWKADVEIVIKEIKGYKAARRWYNNRRNKSNR